MGSAQTGPSWSVGRSQLREPAVSAERWWSLVSLCLSVVTAAATHATFWQRQASVWTLEGAMRAVAFSVTLLLLLGAHEAGHVAAARVHGLALGWPVFLPAPLWFGTLGAILRWPSQPVSPQARFAIAAAGPAAGFAATALVSLTVPGVFPAAGGTSPVYVGSSWLASALIDAEPLDPADPVRFACWVFLWVSSVNLLPFGELDGGHLLQALMPRWHRQISWAVVGMLIALGSWWPGWWLWCAAMVGIARSRASGVARSGVSGISLWLVALSLWSAAALAWVSVPFHV